MIVVVSGEGTTDLGSCFDSLDNARGDDFRPGPMAWIIDRIIERELTEVRGYEISTIEVGAMIFIPKSQLERRAKTLVSLRRPIPRLRGAKKAPESAYYFDNARSLAAIARELAEVSNDDEVLAVLFRDGDGTASQGRGFWEDKVRSVHAGFEAERFEAGVPMIPRPKSEAWLLCALRPYAYLGCESLEERSGNDASPNGLKAELSGLPEFASLPLDRDSLCELVRSNRIDPSKIDMPSFNRFRDRLQTVVRTL